jgi:hypothetical protein
VRATHASSVYASPTPTKHNVATISTVRTRRVATLQQRKSGPRNPCAAHLPQAGQSEKKLAGRAPSRNRLSKSVLATQHNPTGR